MSHREPPGRAPDFTTAFLVTLGGILFMAFFTLAALAGFVAVLICAAGLDLALRLAARRRSRR